MLKITKIRAIPISLLFTSLYLNAFTHAHRLYGVATNLCVMAQGQGLTHKNQDLTDKNHALTHKRQVLTDR